ncbi:MAG TPA: DUF2807 domain-containing protein [Cytophagaceae bacterium]
MLALITSCGGDDLGSCLKGTGTIVKKTISVQKFRTIYVEDNINLVFSYDKVQSVLVEAGENLIDNIEIEDSDNSIKISNKNTCNWLRSFKTPINVYISSPSTCEIYKSSSGEITSKNTLKWEEIIIHQFSPGNIKLDVEVVGTDIDINGLGDVVINGTSGFVKANLYNLSSTAYGVLDTRNLITNQFELLSDTQADCFVYSNGSLNAYIKNIGNVHYFGNPPQKVFKDEGDGEFIKGD